MSFSISFGPDERRAFLDRRRQINVTRMDTLFAPTYDEHWGHINPTHAEFVERFASMVRTGGEILDAACGTGKYWPALSRAGLRVVGVDHSDEMLSNARAKDSTVPTRRCALQDLGTVPEFTGRFDGFLCVDALENVGPEDWPRVLEGLRSTLTPGAPAYLTVELPEERDEPSPPDEPAAPLVEGEVLDGGAYHYYPAGTLVLRWLESTGFEVTQQDEGDGYHHFLCVVQPIT